MYFLSGGQFEGAILAAENAKAVPRELAEITGVEPPVVVDHPARGVLIVEISGHHVRALHKDLLIAVDTNRDTRNGETDIAASPLAVGAGDGDAGRRLGQAPTFQYLNVVVAIGLFNAGRKRRTRSEHQSKTIVEHALLARIPLAAAVEQ